MDVLDDVLGAVPHASPAARERWQVSARFALQAWDLTVEAAAGAGVGMPVLAVCAPDGTRGALKLGDVGHQARVLRAAGGRGYARVLAYDAAHQALLLEKLGGELGRCGLTVVAQARVAARVLQQAWSVPLSVAERLPHGKAAGLIELIDTVAVADHDAAVAQARAWAVTLAADEAVEVCCHGDPHPGNCLQRGESWAFVDPDGFAGERAYDLGVVLRGYCREAEAAERYRPGAGTVLLREVCGALAGETGIPAARIWRWGFVERVTTGLYLHRLGREADAEPYLRVADLLAASGSGAPASP